MLKKTIQLASLCCALLVGGVEAASAETLIKFPLGEVGTSDFVFDGTTLHTVDDGDGTTVGNQDSILQFTGVFDAVIADITSPIASVTISGIGTSGPAVLVGTVITQLTSGGSYAFYDQNNVLLLSGLLNTGAISGAIGAPTGAYFDTTFGTFTGGTLLPYVVPTTSALSIALNDIRTGGAFGLAVSGTTLQAFTSDAAGTLSGTPVPEPLTGLLLISGLAAGARMRRKVAA